MQNRDGGWASFDRGCDKVALTCPNLPYFPIAYFGILKTGAAVVPLSCCERPTETTW